MIFMTIITQKQFISLNDESKAICNFEVDIKPG